ncbi:MAG: hypothetical protein MI799_05165 [Desulfobacterales bacterium]|nr:hypothetical protein [Desulfobacterales bacterium]
MRELDLSPEKSSELGSDISIGHLIGCAGAPQIVTPVHQMSILCPIAALFNHLGDANRFCKDFFGPVGIQWVDDQGPELKTLPLNQDPF